MPRGSGTGLSGGALPVAGGVVIALSRLNRVLDVDIPNRRVTVEPGVTNLAITKHVAPYGYYYAPDPSSQQVCSIGGNVAENSGGAHCLKYGFTTHHVLALDFILPDGEMVTVGSAMVDTPGPDLIGLIVGSEGTLGIATRAVVRILRRPESVQTFLAAFDSIGAGGAAVSAIIGAGIVPAAIEMMDALAIQAAEAAVQRRIPEGRHDPDRRARRAGGRGPRSVRRGPGRLPPARGERDRGRGKRGATGPDLAWPQGGVCGDGPRGAQLLRAGRRRATDETARGARTHSRPRHQVWPSDRQRVPCRRRQPASAHLLRRQRAGRSRSSRRCRGRDPLVLRRGRRIDHRRARRRRATSATRCRRCSATPIST